MNKFKLTIINNIFLKRKVSSQLQKIKTVYAVDLDATWKDDLQYD